MLLIFCAILLVSVLFGISVVPALAAGLALFLIYGKLRGFTGKELVRMCLDGIKTAKNILITFILIGMLTALWRASGCIPAIVCYASGLIAPSVFVLLTFLLNCLVSVLTGTAFGTAATMGVICMTIATSMSLPPFFVGGAILSGVYFGDRCSPVSTSALLVATLTKTDIYTNIYRMIKTSAVPFALTCAVYFAAGMLIDTGVPPADPSSVFTSAFKINLLCLLPAASVGITSLCRLNVKITMAVSIAVSFIIAAAVQGLPVKTLLPILIKGYECGSAELAPMIDGGGILSMLKVSAVILIASCYSGIFAKTGILVFLQNKITKLAEKSGIFAAMLLISVPASCVACNQTLSIMLTHQLTSRLTDDREELAEFLENSAVVAAPLVPWSIAGTVPLASVGAPDICIAGAVFLYLLPLWRLLISSIKKRAFVGSAH